MILGGGLTLRGVLEACFGPWNCPSVFGPIKCHEAPAEWHFCAQIREILEYAGLASEVIFKYWAAYSS